MNIIRLSPKQAEAARIAEDNSVVLFGGAIRGGKTYWLLIMLWAYAKKYPNSRWAVFRNTYVNLVNNTLVTLSSLLNQGLDADVAEYNSQKKLITFHNKSTIQFMAENYYDDKEMNRFKGMEINGCAFDEINECQEQTFDKMLERAGSWFHSPGCPTKILASCNPIQNWVKRRFYDTWKIGNMPLGWAYVPSRIFDNPHVPTEFIDMKREQMTKFNYEVFVNGNWDIKLQTGGEFYKCFSLEHNTGNIEYDPSLALHISFDENVNPGLPLLITQIKDKKIKVIDEVLGISPRNTVKDVCAEFKRRYPSHQSGLFLYGDATSRKEDTKQEKGQNFFKLIMNSLVDYKPSYRVPKSNPSVVMRGNWINTVLEKEIGGVSILISNKCDKTITDFLEVKEAADGTKSKTAITNNETKVRYQPYGHFSDAFDYIACVAFHKEYTEFQRGGAVTPSYFGSNTNKNIY